MITIKNYTLNKKILLSSFLLLMGYVGYSQTSFGIKSGINIATTKDIIAFPKNRLGWYAGGFATISLNKKLFLQPELLYSAKGYRYIGNLNETKKTVLRLNYITLPVLLGYKIHNNISLFLGPEFAYLLSAQNILSNNEKFNVSNNYPVKFDLSLNVGLNYKISKSLGFEIRYSNGFKTMYFADARGNRIGETLGGNRVLQIGSFFTFPSR